MSASTLPRGKAAAIEQATQAMHQAVSGWGASHPFTLALEAAVKVGKHHEDGELLRPKEEGTP